MFQLFALGFGELNRKFLYSIHIRIYYIVHSGHRTVHIVENAIGSLSL